jgi:hypothetical protein
VVDAVFFAISAIQTVQNPTWGNAGWLALDAVSLLPIVPSLGYFRYGDEALQLYNRVTNLVERGGVEVLQHVVTAIQRFGDGNSLFPSGIHIAQQFGKIAGVPGSEKLIQRLANQSFPSVKGYVFALDYAATHADEIAEIERSLGGGRSIDIVLQNGTFVELKHYNWSSEYYQNASNLRRTTNDFLQQLDVYQDYAERVEFVFYGSVPDSVRTALEAAGGIVSVTP